MYWKHWPMLAILIKSARHSLFLTSSNLYVTIKLPFVSQKGDNPF